MSKYTRGLLFFGTPQPGFNNKFDRPKEQEADLRAWFTDGEIIPRLDKAAASSGETMTVYFMAGPFIIDEIISIVLTDMMLSIFSVSIVFLYLWYVIHATPVAPLPPSP